MPRWGFLVLVGVVHAIGAFVRATKYDVMAGYLGSDCNNTAPYAVYARPNGGCGDGVCYEYAADQRASTDCSKEDYLLDMRDFFGSSPYIIHTLYSDEDCSTFEYAVGFLATNSCLGGNLTTGLYYESSLNADGLAVVLPYYEYVGSKGSMEGDSSCSAENVAVIAIDKDDLKNHSCVSMGNISIIYDYFATDTTNAVSSYRWYSSNDVDTNDSSSSSSSGSITTESGGSSLSGGAVVGIILAGLVFVAIIVAFIFRNRFNTKRTTSSHPSSGTGSLEAVTSRQRGLWDDDIITAKRIPRDKIKVKKVIRRGAFGEVYSGVYNRQRVAIKMLLPATPNNVQHVNDFLAETKLTAVLEHPHIVNFVGVAWDSLSDLCVALEYMDCGDLRALLNKHEASNHPVGFDREKAMIALHVCHALTYLHSFSPPMIHRDLKFRNILLTKTMEAKLSDFGVSREQLDQTMTAGVGSTLWMAPEVMLGERYDDKVDMFSFGMVLSELDMHTLPYAQERKRCHESEGRELADATLLQRVMTGKVRVEFSYLSPRSIVELGHAWVSIDPTERPSAAEALYRLQTTMAKELHKK